MINVSAKNTTNRLTFLKRKPVQNEKMKKLLKDSEHMAISKKPKRQQLYKLYELIVNRKWLQYTMFHVFEEYFRCLCLKSKRSLKDPAIYSNSKRHLYFKKAMLKLKHDLDIAGLLQNRYGLEIIKSILFDDEDLKLLSFQKRLVINSDTD